MNTRQLESYQEFTSLPIKDRWTGCTLGLEHSVSGDDYWLACEIKFTVGQEVDLYILIGRGSRSDEELVISYLEENGFELVLRRAMREWEYFDYQRE
jgi:3'-phosphoadenosine 5'-phosphosulfate sulfotransferase